MSYVYEPGATITIAGRSLTSFEAGLVRMRIRRGPSGCHDDAELVLYGDSKFADAAPGDEISIDVGERDSEETVFTGRVTRAVGLERGLRLEALSATAALSGQRTSAAFREQSIADIARELAGDVSIDADADAQLESYVVDDRRSVWSHLVELAELAGAELLSDADGGLILRPPKSGLADVTLRYGADLIAWDVGSGEESEAPAVAAFGAASEEGADRWHWIRNAPSAGDGVCRVVAAFRNKDAADNLSEALAGRAGRAKVQGRLTAIGQAEVLPGAVLEVGDAPAGLPAQLRVLGLEHVFDSDHGFVSILSVEGGDGGGLPF